MTNLLAHRYRVLGELGRGGLGSALRVRDEATQREVCLKLLDENAATTDGARSMRREFELLRGLVHDNLARAHDFGFVTIDGAKRPFFTSELAPGSELEGWARRATWREVASAIGGPLAALAFLHRRGIRHGDFKPDNVLCDERGHAILIDLSCAARIGAAAAISGTPGFVAPELLRSRVGDERADLYSVGVTLQRLLEGRADAPVEAVRLAAKLTRDRPEERPASVDEVLDVLGVKPPFAGSSLVQTPTLHGRDELLTAWDRELDELTRWGSLHDVHAKPSRVIVIAGAAGAGRSRLLRELKWRALDRANVIEGFARAVDGVRSMLGRACRDLDILAGVLGGVVAREKIAQHAEPTVLLLDDADAVSGERDMLTSFARSLSPSDPVLFVMTTRAGASHDGIAELGRSWSLPPLSPSAVTAWLHELRPGEAAQPVIEACEGNARRIAAAIDALERGVPAAALRDAVSTGARDATVTSLQAPDDPGERRALALVAASLEPLDPAFVTSRARLPSPDHEAIVLGESGLELASHDRAALWLASVGPDLATWAHRELAEHTSARARAAGPGTLLAATLSARAAYHLALARDPDVERVFLTSREAREKVPRAWIPVAEALAPQAGPELLGAIVRTLQRAGEPRRALAILDGGAHDEDEETDAARDVLRAECKLELGDARAALELSSAALRVGSVAVRAAAFAAGARAHVRLGAHAEALDAAARGLDLVEHARPEERLSREVAADLHECRGIASIYTADFTTAEHELAQAKALAPGGVAPRRLVRLLSYDAILAFRRGELDAARTAYEHALRAAETHAVADQIARCSLNLGTACHQRGELAAALVAYERGERLATALAQDDVLLVLGFDLAKLYADAGALDRAEAKARSVISRAEAKGSGFFVAALSSVLADVALARGDLVAAREGFERAREGFRIEGATREVAEEELEIARVWSLSGMNEEARACIARARGACDFAGAEDLAVRAELLEARFALLASDTDAARTIAARASDRAERARHPELRARALVMLSDVAARAGLPSEASELIDRAHAIWDRMTAGMTVPQVAAFWARPERAAARRSSGLPAQRAGVVPREPRSEDRRSATLARLIASFRKLNSTLETSDVLAMAIDEAIELTGAERGFLVLDRGSEQGLDVAVARNVDRASLDQPDFRFSRSIAEEAILSANVVLTVDAQSDARFRSNVSVHAMKLRSVIAVPIRSPEGVLGALYLDNRYAPARFDDADTDLLLAFADQVALALRNARLVDTLRRRQDELDAERRRVEELARGQALEIERLAEEVRLRQEALEHRFDYSAIVGRAPALQRVFSMLDRVIDSPLAVLVTGESGTGKELVARAIHYGSERKKGPFMGINCAALPAALLESELFGHVRGAFTGADRDRTGLVVAAHGGTLFLDELGEMPLEVQAKLLRVLQEKEVRAVGSSATTPVDFRLVCATNRDLSAEVARGRFREDLYYRVGVVEVRLPALRERITDLPELAAHFVKRAATELGRPVARISAGALRKLSHHDWPGNVRELENVLTKAVVLAEGAEIGVADIELSRRADSDRRSGRPASKAPVQAADERSFIVAALEQTRWNAVRAAKNLGMPRATFYRRLKALGLERPSR